ncbi:MAG: tetraacyldisaccharide 4'-kinase [Candidatus Omnitrophota bacterium]|nr:tetraacyldisaccharide 4'-kinase [Candidatus Omnitrophota bacterium]
MTDFIYSLMTDRRRGIAFVPLKFALHIASLAYALGLFARRLLYRFGVFKTDRVPIKVISVGNITLGGTGKTPFVMALARILKDELKKEAAVLIRGYGWDEQAMLKENLPDVPVLAGEDRARSSHRAIKLYGIESGILDDGFQHWELARDIDIVLVDSRNPFGNNHLFPRGILREPRGSLARADIVVFTKVNKKAFNIGMIKEEVRSINPGVTFLEAMHSPKYVYDIRSKMRYETSFLKGKRLMLVSGIGDPGYFEETVTGLGSEIAEHIAFGDHHNYREGDIKRILKRCSERKFDFILTTEKDAVKLHRMHLSFGPYSLMKLAVEMDIISGKEILIARLHSLYNR